MKNTLSPSEFLKIQNALNNISDSWADLWLLLHLTKIMVTRLIRLKHNDIHDNIIVLPSLGRYHQQRVMMSEEIKQIISRRREKYPNDIYLFQSHSNRMKNDIKPVTITAFNQALKVAARGVTDKVVSSKSAK